MRKEGLIKGKKLEQWKKRDGMRGVGKITGDHGSW